MLPDVVTYWDGPLDRLRQLCLRSQIRAGHRVTVYSFNPVAALPDGVANASAETVLSYDFTKRLRPPEQKKRSDWTRVQFSDFFRMKLLSLGAGLWLDADVLLLKPVEIKPQQPLFAWEGPLLLGNAVLYLSPDDPIVTAFMRLMDQEDLMPDWLAIRHRATFAVHRLFGRTTRVSDVRLALYGPAALTALAKRHRETRYALAKKSFYAVHAQPQLFFGASGALRLVDDPGVIGLHISPKERGNETPVPGSLFEWASRRFE